MFGYVITNNNTGTETGFWSPFPRLVVKANDVYRKMFGVVSRRGYYRWAWDWWPVRSELAYRREQY